MAERNNKGSASSAEEEAEQGWLHISRASLLTGYGAVEAAHSQMALAFSRQMLGSLFILNTGAILGLGGLLSQLPPGAVEAQEAIGVLTIFIAAYGAALVAGAAAYWNAELRSLEATAQRNQEIEALNFSYPGVASPAAHALEARRWTDDAERKRRGVKQTFFVSWGVGLLGLALSVWGIVSAAQMIASASESPPVERSEPVATAAPEQSPAGRIDRLESQLELHPPTSTDAALLARVEQLEGQLEFHPPTPSDPTAVERLERLENQLELQPPKPTDAGLPQRVGQLEQQLEMHPADPDDPALMARLERLESQLELQPPKTARPALNERIERLERQLEMHPTKGDASSE